MSAPDLPIGAKVRVKAGVGVVRWSGTDPAFAPGKWVGIELETATGKNNGSVQGEAYFECEMGYGVFVRPSQAQVIEAPATRRAPRQSTLSVSSGGAGSSAASSRLASRATTPATRPGAAPRPSTAGTGASTPATPTRTASRPTSGTGPSPRPSVGGAGAAATRGGAVGTGTAARGAAAGTRGRPPVARGGIAGRRTSVVPSTSPLPGATGASARRASSLASSRDASRVATPADSSAQGSPPSRAPRTPGAKTEPPPEPRPTDEELMPPPPVPPRTQSPPLIMRRPSLRTPTPVRASARTPTRTPTPSDDGGAAPRSLVPSPSPSRDGRTITAPTSPRSPLTSRASARNPSPDRETAAAVFAQKHELDELRIKVRLLEKHHAQDQEKIRTLETKATEGDQLHAIRAKLQVKFQEQASTIGTLQRENRDLRSENAHLETQRQEAMDHLEMATLDREVAEEKAEAAEADVERLNEKIQELEMEVAVLKEENAEYEKPIDGLEGERSSLAFVQLEKHNERLKEAVIKLRDMLGDTEKEFKAKIQDLEKELSSHDDLAGRVELAESKLASSEAQVDDLKQQLDDALGAEDLLEELTERNLQMSEKIEEMRATIDDLEALKELNDELEEGHLETEKQLEADLDALSAKLKDEVGRSGELEALVVDMEATIGQFRDLVSSLQSEIDELRVQQATQEHESASASKESQALLNLNLKLQSSAAKTQSKTVDLELKKLEAAQLAEHLRIVQAYLPDAYHETEADSTTALLFFLRVAEKTSMLSKAISNLYGLPAALHTVSSEPLVGVCELRGKLRHFSTLNRRFAAVMRRTDADDFVSLGKVLGELAGVESKVDGWVSMVKSDEFNEGDCARELDALTAQFNHLAEATFDRPGLDAGEQQVALAYALEDDLDNYAAAIGFVRTEIMALVKDGDVDVDAGDSSLDEAVYEPVQHVLNQVRAVKAPVGKLVSVVDEVAASQAALLPEFSDGLRELASSVSHGVDMAVRLAQRIRQHVDALRLSKGTLRVADVDKFLREVTGDAEGEDAWDVLSASVTRLGTDLGDTLPKFRNAPKAGQTLSLSIPAPWLARVAAIKEAASYNAEAERKVARLTDELRDMVREIKLRDVSLEEGGVKIETLERRLEGLRKQADHILELEADLAAAKALEREHEETISALRKASEAAEAEAAKLRSTGGGAGTAGSAAPAKAAPAAAPPPSPEHADGMAATLRFLRSENALLRSRDMYADVHMFTPLRALAPKPRLAGGVGADGVPELVADEGEDSDAGGSDADAPTTPGASPRSARQQRPVTRHALDTESKLILRAVADYAASPRIVDISAFSTGGTGWHSRRNSPEIQAWRFKNDRRRLEDRVAGLAERVNALRR